MTFTDHRNHRVLIVDGQKKIHNDFAEILQPRLEPASKDLESAFIPEKELTRQSDYELLHATSGEEACEIIKAGKETCYPVSIAYVDIKMSPGIDGIETVHRLSKIDRDVDLVIMIAYTDRALPEVIRKMELLYKLLYVRKPFTPEEIQQTTIFLIEKRNIEQQLKEELKRLSTSYHSLKTTLDAAEDPMAMWDASGRALFANPGYQKLFDLSENALKKISPEAFLARYKKRLRELNLTNEKEENLFLDGGNIVEEITNAKESRPRLFYRSIRPVVDNQGEVLGRNYVYRDISKEIEVERMRTAVLSLRAESENNHSFANLVGSSSQMQKVYSLIKRAAESNVTVLISGESGTGKELVAKCLHHNSPRKNGHFLAINCAAIPESLIESELFGHERGSFTGAFRKRIGSFEYAGEELFFLTRLATCPWFLKPSSCVSSRNE